MKVLISRIRRERKMWKLCGELGSLSGEIAVRESYDSRPERVSLLRARRDEIHAEIRRLYHDG